MDPLTALSLVGNIIQFVDFGSRLLSTTKALYKSPLGSLAVHDELELVTTDLSILVTKLKQDWEGEPSSSVRKICDEAADVATEIITRLGRMKVKEGKYRELRSAQAAIRQAWSGKELKVLEERLGRLREAIGTRVLFSLSESLDAQSIHMSTRFNSIDQQTQRILTAILETRERASGALRDRMTALTATMGQLLSRLECMSHDNHHEVRGRVFERISKGTGQFLEMEELTAAIEMFEVSDQAERRMRVSIQDRIIRSLSYPAMTNRYENVLEPHPETFEWAFHDPNEQQRPWSNLSDWLKMRQGVYWVSGKAGSGKSTFMKHLFDSGRTEEYLQSWAGDDDLCITTFFFWNSGTMEQRSHAGCLRALLFQVLQKFPDLVPLVLPRRWGNLYSKVVQDSSIENDYLASWPLLELMDAFEALVQQKGISLKICFLIDGLDEFDGDHEALAKLFKKITDSKNIKVCLSSRPWVVFEDIFGSCMNLRLQNLTFPDIEQYVSDKLRGNDAFERLSSQEPIQAISLRREIVEKADGVFLWVKLVVQSLLNGIRNRDNLSDLWERLLLLPMELEPLYHRLLDLIEPIYLPWVSKAFQIVRINRTLNKVPFGLAGKSGVNPLSIYGFAMAMNTEAGIERIRRWKLAQLPVVVKYEDIIVQLTARCAGFLEIPDLEEEKGKCGHSLIEYFHRTARDFLETDVIWSKLLIQTAGTDFDPNVAMMRSCIMSLRLGSCIDLTKDFMIYAQHADKHTNSHDIQSALLDRLDEMRTSISRMIGMYENEWNLDLVPRPRHGSRFVTLLELATLYGLRAYVKDKLSQFEGAYLEKAATGLLHYLLPGKNELPLPRLEMVSLLLDFGADPNDQPGCPSAWENTLCYTTAIMDTLGSCEPPILSDDVQLHAADVPTGLDDALARHILRSRECDVDTPGRRYIQILQRLLLAGADPRAHVLDLNAQANALGIIETYLMPKFPREAGQLLRELNQALEATKSSTAQKRGKEEDGISEADGETKRKKQKRQRRRHKRTGGSLGKKPSQSRSSTWN